jgi:hypothetical protein
MVAQIVRLHIQISLAKYLSLNLTVGTLWLKSNKIFFELLAQVGDH